MKFTVTVEEQIKVWATVPIYVEAESKEEIEQAIKNGTFISEYAFDFGSYDYMLDTCETIAYDTSNVEIEEGE